MAKINGGFDNIVIINALKQMIAKGASIVEVNLVEKLKDISADDTGL